MYSLISVVDIIITHSYKHNVLIISHEIIRGQTNLNIKIEIDFDIICNNS